jgi:hypothetical protein
MIVCELRLKTVGFELFSLCPFVMAIVFLWEFDKKKVTKDKLVL